jgi:hypothetical protein
VNATLTIVMCLAAEPELCELVELRVNAYACFYAGHNVATAAVPDGYVLRSARCVPRRGRVRRPA